MKSKNYIISFITVFFVSCIFYSSYSQDFKRIAEHHLELKNAQNDSAKITALTKLADKYSDISLDSTLKYSNKAIAISIKAKRGKGIAFAYNSIGDAYWYKSDYLNAQEYYFKAFQISDSLNDKKSMALSLYSMGWIFCVQQHDLSNINYLSKSKQLYAEINNQKGIINANYAIAKSYIENFHFEINNKQYYDSAKYYLEKQKEYFGVDANAKELYYYGSMQLMYYKNDFKSAIFYGEKSVDILKNYENKTDLIDVELYILLSKINLNMTSTSVLNKLDSCFQVFNTDNRLLQKSECLKGLALYHYKKNDYKKAYEYGLQYYDLKNQLDKTIYSSQLSNLKTNYETGKTKNQLDELEQAKELEKQKNKTKNYLLIAVFAGILTVLGFVYSLRKQNKQKQIANKQLEDKNHIIEEKQKEILDSINYAKRIQDSLLASSELIKKYLPNTFVYFNPKDIVSGDFYWACEHNNCLYLAICDSTGHGVPGAFMSFLNMAYLSEAISEKNISEPHTILNYVRTRLENTISKEGQRDGMDGILFKIENTDDVINIEYAAANNHPILITNNQLLEQPKDKMPIGKGEKSESFVTHSISAKKGDALYLYTDGYADQFGGEKGKKFKYKPLNELLMSIHHLPMQEQKNILSTTFAAWKGQLEQIDDVLIFGIVI